MKSSKTQKKITFRVKPIFLKIISFPIKNVIFVTVQKSSKHKQKQAFFKTEKRSKNNFSCDDAFAVAVAVVVVVVVYIYIYIQPLHQIVRQSAAFASCRHGDTHESSQLVVKKCGFCSPRSRGETHQGLVSLGRNMRLAATSVVLPGNREVK